MAWSTSSGGTSGAIGKPATMVGIEPDARHIVTVSLSEPDQFVGALVNLAGKVVLRRTYERNDRTGADALALLGADLRRPRRRRRPAVARRRRRHPRHRRSRRHRAPRRPPRLEQGCRSPTSSPPAPASVVYVANDANASALAELTFGVAHSSDFLMVRVDQGVGVGLVLDGALYRGSRSASGEIGHVVVDPDGSICTCGKRGCLETEISAPLLGRRLGAAGSDGEIEILRRAGERLGTALATVLSALDIGDVILSGPEPVATETFRQATLDAVAARTMPEISERPDVAGLQFGDDDVVLGAAALVLDEELDIR